ncbi:MAG: heme-binding protein [Alphaproteobacteria bacterium]|nr:heme-binding protein [Alphaproteobacteria bacterium]
MTPLRRGILSHPAFRATMAVLSVWCMAPGGCGGGGGQSGPLQPQAVVPATPGPGPANTSPNLTTFDVDTIVLQAINEANARGKPATIAVVDRVGNVLALTQMAGAPAGITIVSGRNPNTGLENRTLVPPNAVPSTEAAISKAITGAYLSSNGNAFSTRTANYIVQEHFPPGVQHQGGGPLFGVQFSQLSCSDFNTVFSPTPGVPNGGPHRSPLGFSADSGGLPVYKNGVLVGGIGVMTKNTYGDNLTPLVGVPIDDDEVIALAGETGYTPPPSITADNIAVGGLTLQYVDATPANFAAPVSGTGTYTPVALGGYFAGPAAGQASAPGLIYGSADGASGIAPDGALGPVLYPGTLFTAYVFTDGAGRIRFPPTNGISPPGQAITAAEAQALEISALNVAFSARAAIRIPTNSFAQVTVSVVDLDGNILAMARTPDAPIFGADVSLQKARSAVFFSRTDAAAKVTAITIPASTTSGTFAQYITDSQTLTGDPTVFADGLAWSEVGIGDIARPFYPDGIENTGLYGSLSLPINRWSIFSTGIQLDLVAPDILQGVFGALPPATGCGTGRGLGTGLPVQSGGKTQLANGMQIFSGGFPIYRGNTLVGGIGISGDGIQQDSMISFLGLQNFSEPTPGMTALNNAPAPIRDDNLNPQGMGHLRYVNCPANPFLNQNVQNPC